jgi:hypothetical protein
VGFQPCQYHALTGLVQATSFAGGLDCIGLILYKIGMGAKNPVPLYFYLFNLF